jgi:hypothetical protein
MPTKLTMNDPYTAQNVVESVTESHGKIVVTTTISLDRDALEARLPFSRAAEMPPVPGMDTELASADNVKLQMMQQAVSDGRITMLQIAPKPYIGFVNGRQVKAHPLCIGDTLFVFVSRHNSLTGMAELIAELMGQVPANTVWNDEERSRQIENIAYFLKAS